MHARGEGKKISTLAWHLNHWITARTEATTAESRCVQAHYLFVLSPAAAAAEAEEWGALVQINSNDATLRALQTNSYIANSLFSKCHSTTLRLLRLIAEHTSERKCCFCGVMRMRPTGKFQTLVSPWRREKERHANKRLSQIVGDEKANFCDGKPQCAWGRILIS